MQQGEMAPFLRGILMGAMSSSGALQGYEVLHSEDHTVAIIRFTRSGNTYRVKFDYLGITTAIPAKELLAE